MCLDANRTLLRTLILTLLVKLDHKETVDKLFALFEEYVKGDTSVVHPDLRSLMFGVAAKKHAKATEHLSEIHATCGNSGVERDALRALGKINNADELKKIFDEGIIGEKFRAQDLVVSHFKLTGICN